MTGGLVDLWRRTVPGRPAITKTRFYATHADLPTRQNGQRLNAPVVAATGFCCPCDVTAV
jgi:hypothetical protein